MKYKIAILMFDLCLLPFNAMAEGLLDGITAGIHAGGCPEGRPCPVETFDETHKYMIQANPDYGAADVGINRDGYIKNIGGQKPRCDNPVFNRNGVEVGCQ